MLFCKLRMILERASHHDALGIRVNDVHKVRIRGIQPHIYRTEVLQIWNGHPIMMLLESVWMTSTKSAFVGPSHTFTVQYWSIKNLPWTSHHDALGICVNDVNKVRIRGVQPHIYEYRIEVLKIWNGPPIMKLLESVWMTSTESTSVESSHTFIVLGSSVSMPPMRQFVTWPVRP